MARSPQKLEEARKGSPLEAPEGPWACRQPDFRPLPPEYDRRCVCCCKAPRLWHFVAPVPVLEGHTLCGHTSSRWQRRDSYPSVSAPQGHKFPSFSPISCSPSSSSDHCAAPARVLGNRAEGGHIQNIPRGNCHNDPTPLRQGPL